MTTVDSTLAPFPAPDVDAAVRRALVAANDWPRPSLDNTRSPQKYRALAQDFRDSAWQHLDAGDLPQASNKAWGLVAETVKDIAAQHGAIIHTPQGIAEVIVELARLVGNAGDLETCRWINRVLMIAGRLHSNFYENDLREDTVLAGLMQCEELSTLLYRLFGAAPAPAV